MPNRITKAGNIKITVETKNDKQKTINANMNLGNFTIKAAEAIQQAQQLAFNAGNPNIETEHILKALLEQEDSPVEYLLKKNNVTVNLVDSKLEELISRLPKT